MAVEVGGGDTGGVGNVMVIGQRLSGKGFAPEDAPVGIARVAAGKGRGVRSGVPDRTALLRRRCLLAHRNRRWTRTRFRNEAVGESCRDAA